MSRWSSVLCNCFLFLRISVFFIFLDCCLVSPFHALGALEQGGFVCAQPLSFWGRELVGGSRVPGACRPLEEPGKMVPFHGALVVKYTFPAFPHCFTWLCKLPELRRAPGSRCWRIFCVVEGGVPPPSCPWSPGSSEGMEALCCGAADGSPACLIASVAESRLTQCWSSFCGRGLVSRGK